MQMKLATTLGMTLSCLLVQSSTLSAEPKLPQSVKQEAGKKSLSSTGKYQSAAAKMRAENADPGQKSEPVDLVTSAKVQKIGDDEYRIGKVGFNKKSREVSLPIKVNMRHGVVEYLLVTEEGKVHESVFTTSASPTNIHLACVLLGMPELKMKDWPRDYTEIPKIHAIEAKVTWPTNGPAASIALSQCVSRVNTSDTQDLGDNIEKGSWLYNGSMFFGGVFVAQQEGSVISIIGDRESLINGLRVGRENDELHAANERVLPKSGRTLKLVLTLPEQPKK